MSTTRLLFFLIVPVLLTMQVSAVTTLWTKTITAETSFSYRVGSDGTVAIVYGVSGDVRKIYWIARSGEYLRIIEPPEPDFNYIPIYVSQDELMLRQGGGTALFQFVQGDRVEHTHLPFSVGIFQSRFPFSYPYVLLVEDKGNQAYEFSLRDLTNPNSLTIVGDAVIGVHGKNLKVRWKSIVNAKYKVQYSDDLTTWTDYTEVLDGTGATIIVNVPIDEDASSLYARVVKL